MDTLKRVGPEDSFNIYNGVKKSKQAMESLSTGMESKMMLVTKWVGTPNQVKVHVAPFVDGSVKPAAKKTRLCCDYNTPPLGCKFGDKCHFAHGICDIGKPFTFDGSCAMASGRYGGGLRRNYKYYPLTVFRDPLKANIYVNACHVGAIIGDYDLKQKLREMEVNLFIIEHDDLNPNPKNLVELEFHGMIHKLQVAISMVLDVIHRSQLDVST